MDNKKVVFILGLGHSGGTLLGNILDVHPRILHIGEIPAPFVKGHRFRCYYCGEKKCPIWGTLIKEDFVRTIVHDFLSYRKSQSRIGKFWRKYIQSKKNRGGDLYLKIFSVLKGVDIIIDKSLDLNWIEYNRQNNEYKSLYILLIRDFRGVIASRKRRSNGKELIDIIRTEKSKFKDVLKFYRKLPANNKEIVRYEDLVIYPDSTLLKVANFLGIQYIEEFLEYYKYPHHIIGGNRNVFLQELNIKGESYNHLLDDIREEDVKYYTKIKGFKLDERWKVELTKEEIQLINKNFNKYLRQFNYEINP